MRMCKKQVVTAAFVIVVCCMRLGAGESWASQPSVEAAFRQVKGKDTNQIKKDLKGKSKAEVKAYFGRKPVQVVGEQWIFDGKFYDPDAEKQMTKCTMLFVNDQADFILFLDL